LSSGMVGMKSARTEAAGDTGLRVVVVGSSIGVLVWDTARSLRTRLARRKVKKARTCYEY
jgi:hypothetical protein